MAEKYLDKLIKVITIDDRNLIGKLKCIDNFGNIYINETCEVFDKNDDYCTYFDIYKNNSENYFSFDSDKNYYQMFAACLVPKKEIKDIFILSQ